MLDEIVVRALGFHPGARGMGRRRIPRDLTVAAFFTARMRMSSEAMGCSSASICLRITAD